MNVLQNYVDELFKHQKLTAEITELKEEVLSNMMAKREDLVSQGMDEAAATQKAKESLTSIDSLIEGNQLTDVAHYRTECLQAALINSIVLWILSLPLLFFPSYAVFSYAGILSTVVVGLFYLVQSKKPAGNFAFLSVAASIRRRKRIWILWGLFFIVSTVTIAAVTFGSYLWYGWPVDISGPYQTANIAIRFYLPLLTIAVPITVGNFTKILLRNEMGCGDE